VTKRFQVVGIGNALVDVLAYCDEAFMEMNGVRKGIMQLIDVNRGIDLYSRIGPAREISGGSVANSVTGIAQLGGRAAFVGKIKDDQLGSTFADDMRAQGIVFDTSPAPDCHPAETGRCIVLVTPDGERSMNTYLGVTEFLVPSDIDEGMMADAEWIFLEGYRFDGPESQEAFAKAIFVSRNAGGKVAITLSDPFCVERHRDAFGAMLRDHADLVLANRGRASVDVWVPRPRFRAGGRGGGGEAGRVYGRRKRRARCNGWPPLARSGDNDGSCGPHRRRRPLRRRVPLGVGRGLRPGDLRAHGKHRRVRDHRPHRSTA